MVSSPGTRLRLHALKSLCEILSLSLALSLSSSPWLIEGSFPQSILRCQDIPWLTSLRYLSVGCGDTTSYITVINIKSRGRVALPNARGIEAFFFHFPRFGLASDLVEFPYPVCMHS
eukprot:scaffold148380_cov28-Tisochrysis_lutea.AAC.5